MTITFITNTEKPKEKAFTLIKEYPSGYVLGNGLYEYIAISTEEEYYDLIQQKPISYTSDYGLAHLNTSTNKLNKLFEIITSDTPKIYYDFDFKPAITTAQFNNILEHFFNIVKTELRVETLEPLIYIRNEPTPNTIRSSHIILHKYRMNKAHQKELVVNITEQTQTEDLLKDLDTTIYTKDRLFNLPNHTKSNEANYENRHFKCYDEYTRTKSTTPENFLVNDTTNTTLKVYENTKANKARTTIKQLLTANTLIKISTTKYNLVENLIKHLPNDFYTKHNYKLWIKLFRYLIKTQNKHYDFLKHSHIIYGETFDEEQIKQFTQTTLENERIHYDYALYDIVNKYNILFYIDSCLTSEFIQYVNTITQTDLTATLEENELEYFLSTLLHKKRKLITHENFTINTYENIIIDNKNNTFYYEPLNRPATTNEYKNICCKTITDIAQLGELMKTITINIDDNDKEAQQQVFIVKALYGSGKTKIIINTLLSNLYETHKDHKKLKTLFLTSNNALNEETAKKLKLTHSELVVEYHQNDALIEQLKHAKKNNDKNPIETLAHFTDIYISSMESILTRQPIKTYDIVILDEYVSILDHFFSSTMESKKTNNGNSEYDKYVEIKRIIKQSKIVLALDADINLESVNVAKKFIRNDALLKCYYLEDNNFKNYTIYNYYKYIHLLFNFKQDIKNGLRVAFCSSSKNEVKTQFIDLTTNHPHLKIIMINGDDTAYLHMNGETEPINKNTYLSNIQHFTTEKYKVDVMLYTPTITTGISIETSYFHKLYAVAYSKNTPIARVVNQMLFRNRNLLSKQIHIGYFNMIKYKSYVDKAEVYKFYNTNKYYDNLYQETHPNHKTDELFKMLYVNHRQEKNICEIAFIQELLDILKNHQLNIKNINSNENYNDTLDLHINANEEMKTQEVINICKAHRISYSTNKYYTDNHNLVINNQAHRTLIRYEKLKYFMLKLGAYTDKPQNKIAFNKEQLKDKNLIPQDIQLIKQKQYYNQIVYEYDREDRINKLISILATPTTTTLTITPSGYIKVTINITINKIQDISKITSNYKLLAPSSYIEYNKCYNFLTANHKDLILDNLQKAPLYKKTGLLKEDEEAVKNNVKHSVYKLLQLTKHNNFTYSYSNENFKEHIENHKKTIQTNWDFYCDILKQPKTHFKNIVKIEDLIEEVKRFIGEMKISYIHSSNIHSYSTLIANPKYQKLNTTFITLTLQKPNHLVGKYLYTPLPTYIYTTPYHITIPHKTSIKVIEHNVNVKSNFKVLKTGRIKVKLDTIKLFTAITLTHNCYTEKKFSKEHNLLTTSRDIFNINAKQAKETNTKRIRLKEFNNEILHANTINTFIPTGECETKTSILTRTNSDGLVKIFVKIDVAKLYNKAPLITYHTNNKQPIFNTKPPNNNNLRPIHEYIDGINGILTIPKIDYNNFYTKYEYAELMKQKLYEDVKKPKCKWFNNDNQRQYIDNLIEQQHINKLKNDFTYNYECLVSG